jgi:acetyltransferase-like isoleucine patch superfamily enzyme
LTNELIEHDIAAMLPPALQKSAEGCVLLCTQATLAKITIMTPPVPGRRDYRIEVTAPNLRGAVRISLGPGSGTIRIDTAGPVQMDIRTWREMSLHIATGTTISSARLVCDNADISVGKDGLWSDEILVQSNDQHGIIDLTDMSVLNDHRRTIHIAEHVWIGRRTVIMPDVSIGAGDILGTAAVLTGNMSAHTVFGGVPARQLRDNVSWSRAATGPTYGELQYLKPHRVAVKQGLRQRIVRRLARIWHRRR